MARVVSIVLLASVAVHAQPAPPPAGSTANGAPANGVPANGAPVNGVPANGAPANGAPANGVPANGAPANGAPANGAPANGVPANGVPANGAPANGAPPAGAPANAPMPLAPGVMANRWAVAVGLGLVSETPKVDGAPSTGLVAFELSGRYRAWRPIEFGLSLGAATAGNIMSNSLFLDFRYRFWAERPFNIFAGASLGAMTAFDKTNATDAAKRGRGALRFVGGVEWRFDTLALTAELRLFGIGENPDATMPGPLSVGDMLAQFGVGGGALVLGATYYF